MHILNFCDFCSFRFDRDWKKIEAFVGSKTVIQVICLADGFHLLTYLFFFAAWKNI